MAKCTLCEQDMLEVDSCINIPILYSDKTKFNRSTQHFNEASGRCHDCNIKHGGFHHPGCDVERCPKCGLQLISCDCVLFDEEEEDDTV